MAEEFDPLVPARARAEICASLSDATFDRLAAQGEFPSHNCRVGAQRMWKKSDLTAWRDGRRTGWTPTDADETAANRVPTTTFDKLHRYHVGYRDGTRDGAYEGYHTGFRDGFIDAFSNGKKNVDPDWDLTEAASWASERAEQAWKEHLKVAGANGGFSVSPFPAFVDIKSRERLGNEGVGYERGHAYGIEQGYPDGVEEGFEAGRDAAKEIISDAFLEEFVKKQETRLTNITGDAQIAKGVIFNVVVRCYAAPDVPGIQQKSRLDFMLFLMNINGPYNSYKLTNELLTRRCHEVVRGGVDPAALRELLKPYAEKLSKIAQDKRAEFGNKVDALLAEANAKRAEAEADTVTLTKDDGTPVEIKVKAYPEGWSEAKANVVWIDPLPVKLRPGFTSAKGDTP